MHDSIQFCHIAIATLTATDAWNATSTWHHSLLKDCSTRTVLLVPDMDEIAT